jgi:putative FmdB family regulatory protein
MAMYEYRCRTCDSRFEVRRPMAEADAPTVCPGGHEGAVRLLSVFASIGSSASVGPGPAAGAAPGPCGGACACNPG